MRTLCILSLTLLLFSCGKEKKYNRYMNGDWKVVQLKITEVSGIGEYVSSVGTVSFKSEKRTNTGTFNFDVVYDYQNATHSLIENGSYSLNGQNVTLTNSSGVEYPSDLNYVNKEDMEFIIPSYNNKNIYLLMKKIE